MVKVLKQLSFAITFLLLFISCEGKKTDETSNETADVKESLFKDTLACPQTSIFLMDISISMKGYLGSGDSRFLGVINSYLNLSKEAPTIHWFGKNETDGVAKSDFVNLTKNSIQWSDESNIMAMLQSMVKHCNDYDISFLLTDGILSGSNEQICKSPGRRFNIENREWMSGEIKKIFEGNDSLSAIVIRYVTTFKGTYSCYNNDRRSLDGKERPYYIIAIGKWKYVKYIEEQLRCKTTKLNKPYEYYAMYGDEPTYNKIRFSYSTGVKGKDNDSLIIKSDVKRDGEVVLSSDITILPDYMQNEDYLRNNISLSVQDKHQEKELTSDLYSISVDTISNKKIVCKLSILARKLVSRTLFVKVRYKCPSWIDKYTDMDDLNILIDPSKMSQTFNLKYLLDGFTGLQNDEYVMQQTIKFK